MMNKIVRFSLVGFVLASASVPALAQAQTAIASDSVTLSALDEIAACNTARDYLVANYNNALLANGIDVNALLTSTKVTDAGDIVVSLVGPGISAAILLSAEEYEVLNASVRFTAR